MADAEARAEVAEERARVAEAALAAATAALAAVAPPTTSAGAGARAGAAPPGRDVEYIFTVMV